MMTDLETSFQGFLDYFENTREPDWDSLAIFADLCEDLDKQDLETTCRWLVEERKYPWLNHSPGFKRGDDYEAIWGFDFQGATYYDQKCPPHAVITIKKLNLEITVWEQSWLGAIEKLTARLRMSNMI